MFSWIADLEYSSKLRELHSNYLVPDKTETKKEMFSSYQLKIFDLYNIAIGNDKKLVPNLFHKEKYVLHCENLQRYLRLELKLKKTHHVLEISQSQWVKPYVEFNIQKRINAEKNGEKDRKPLYKLMKMLCMERQWNPSEIELM